MKKAKHGDPCTRCGSCCKAEICDVGKALHLTVEENIPCPALLGHSDGTYSCGLLLTPSRFVDWGEAAKWKYRFFGGIIQCLLGVGKGCDSED